MGWDAIGAIAGIIGVFVAIWQGFRQRANKQARNSSSNQLPVSKKAINASDLLSIVYERQAPLSKCISDSLLLARTNQYTNLLWFCENELKGWKIAPTEKAPDHRLISGYGSVYEVNTEGTPYSPLDVYNRMSRDERFFSCNFPLLEPISTLESRKEPNHNSIVVVKYRYGDVIANAEKPDTIIYMYGKPSVFQEVLENTRAELARLLLDLG